jgi:ATP-dependent DNA helicase RecQ
MLVGSKSKEIVDAGLDQLTTYGLLRDLGSQRLHPLFAEMEKAGLIVTSSGEYPVVTLTDRGAEVMRKGGALSLRWPDLSTAPAALKTDARGGGPALQELGFDEELFEKLKRHRNAVAQAEGVPAYVIFSNQTLEFLTRLRPRSVEQALKIRGIGEKKAREYLADFLRILERHA